ncbi:MAG: VOC family protein [Caulobacteraceae bacterium]
MTVKLPSRLHHTAYVSKDLEATRRFYEEVIGLPLMATWCEQEQLFGEERTYAHCFFGLGDGGALAFFQFARPSDHALFGPKMPESPFHHIALNVDAGDPEGYRRPHRRRRHPAARHLCAGARLCRSVYVKTPTA